MPILILALAQFAAAQTIPRLAGIRAELEHVRADASEHTETRGATPRLTTIKHELRDWVESQLSQLPSDPNGEDGAEAALAARLNDELKREHLLREDDSHGGAGEHRQARARQDHEVAAAAEDHLGAVGRVSEEVASGRNRLPTPLRSRRGLLIGGGSEP